MRKLPNFLETQYRADLDVLFLRWLKPVSSEELRKGYACCLEQALAEKAHFWLQDFRSRGAADEKDGLWVVKEFIPKAEKALGGKNYIALLVTPDYEQFVDKTIGLENLLHFSDKTCIKSFYNEGDALHWLKVCQNEIKSELPDLQPKPKAA